MAVLLTPHVVEAMNKYWSGEKAYAIEIAYDKNGKVTTLTSVDEDANELNVFERVHLARWVTDAFEAFVEWYGIEDGGGTLLYSPEGASNNGD